MNKSFIIFIFSLFMTSSLYSQVMVTKLIGKNSKNSGVGFGVFSFLDFPLHINQMENQSIRFEWVDFAYYPPINSYIPSIIAYISNKLGYRYIFSETKTGFYIEPEAGFGQVVINEPDSTNDKTAYGLALALEVGYSLEVGQRGNSLIFGLKYENDLPSSYQYNANSIGFRFAFCFQLLRRKSNYY